MKKVLKAIVDTAVGVVRWVFLDGYDYSKEWAEPKNEQKGIQQTGSASARVQSSGSSNSTKSSVAGHKH